MSRPLIGLSTYLVPAAWSVWTSTTAALLPVEYPALVRAAGGLTAMLPPDDPELAADLVSRLDGLIISGGPDVDPARYGDLPHPRTDPPPHERDAWELALVTAALDQGVPLLGICRGLQVLNVACGGDLIQHLPDQVGHTDHSPTPGAYALHPVTPVPGSRLAELLGEGTRDVPTYHHQAVRRLGRGLTVSAYAPDGTVEAVEAIGSGSGHLGSDRLNSDRFTSDGLSANPSNPSDPDESAGRPGAFALAVQWHPEQGADLRLAQALVLAAGATAVAGAAR